MDSVNDIYELHVTGHAPNELLFSNSTRLSFDSKRMTVFIQTDKTVYKPKQEVKFRVVTLFSDFKPLKTPVNIQIMVSGRQKWKGEFEPFYWSSLVSFIHVILEFPMDKLPSQHGMLSLGGRDGVPVLASSWIYLFVNHLLNFCSRCWERAVNITV